MSISADGGEAQTHNCPDCDTMMDREIITEHGTRRETTLYEGWWCPSCGNGMIDCGECDGLHHPDFICEPQRKARLEAAKDEYGSKAKVPGHGIIPVEELETIGEGTPVYVIEDGCPNPDCDGDRIFEMAQDDNFAKGRRPTAEYQPICDYCSEFGNSKCGYRQP